MDKRRATKRNKRKRVSGIEKTVCVTYVAILLELLASFLCLLFTELGQLGVFPASELGNGECRTNAHIEHVPSSTCSIHFGRDE